MLSVMYFTKSMSAIVDFGGFGLYCPTFINRLWLLMGGIIFSSAACLNRELPDACVTSGGVS